MKISDLIQKWFDIWEKGNFHDLPISENFRHISPYGTMSGRDFYIKLIEGNKDKFLGHKFIVHDILYGVDKACVRYSAIKDDFRLEVSEWHYMGEEGIEEIVAYYNIEGEVSEERSLNMPE